MSGHQEIIASGRDATQADRRGRADANRRITLAESLSIVRRTGAIRVIVQAIAEIGAPDPGTRQPTSGMSGMGNQSRVTVEPATA